MLSEIHVYWRSHSNLHDEERSQPEGFLNIPGAEDDETHSEDDDTHAEDLQDDNADGSNEVYILCIKFIIINFLVDFT